MYKSRLHFKNSDISIALDSVTGDILEINNIKTGENIIKNSCFTLKQPFVLTCKTENEDETTAFHADFIKLHEANGLCANISSSENPDGSVVVLVSYSSLVTANDRIINIPVTYSIKIPENGSLLEFSIDVKNNAEGYVVEKVKFPCINGIYLGETWEDDTLVYPFNAGVKFQNPVKSFSRPQKTIQWKWQEYSYIYNIDGISGTKGADEVYSYSAAYSGPLSMKWLDYYEESGGIYFGSHDNLSDIVKLYVDTFGESCPGMNFAFEKQPMLKAGESMCFDRIVLCLHEGDWHEGADIYRSNKEKAASAPSTRPDWFLKSPGLMAHYDFKYQNGGVVHKYADIPRLYSEACELGINHLLLAGWHKDGFDNGFPNYETDNDLGSEAELKSGVKDVIDNGGHVSFYVNTRLANKKYSELSDFINENVVLRSDNTKHIESYGSKNVIFAAMCAGAKPWQDKLTAVADYVTNNIGIDGLYLDQLGMAPPCVCINKAHGHKPDGWNEGYKTILDDIEYMRSKKAEAPLDIIYEGVTDIHGGRVCGQLISTFCYYHTGAFPELYKYTFPNQILVDMLFPKENMAMRPVHVAQASTAMINKAFITGAYYWIYDLVDDNTFTRDPKQYKYLKDIIALRRFWLENYGQGVFKDTLGFTLLNKSYSAKRFDFGDDMLIAYSSETQNDDFYIKVDTKSCKGVKNIYIENGKLCSAEVRYVKIDGSVTVAAAGKPAGLIYIKK